MTSPMVDRVIKIPLIVEKDVSLPVVNDEMDVDSGFPFDRTPNRSNQILEDLANRHPELAEHFENFGSNRRVPRTTTTTNTDRPFGSRFERFSGFPFDSHRDLFDDDYDDDFERNHRQQQEKSQPKQESQQQQQPESKQECSASDNSSDPTRQRSRKQQNIQQSNTVDLGQKQELVNDRNQRSMSAPPPDNRPRFVSSINIPINRDEQPPQQQQQQQPTQQQQQQKENTTTTQPNRPTERVIPIHVEGRDEPIIPKNVGHSFSNQQTHYQQQQSPQPERIFGQRPSQFTQFLNREPPQRPFSGQRQFDDGFRQPHFQQQQPQFQQQQQQYQQQEQEKFEQQKQEQQQVPQQQQQQKVPPSPIDTIQLIQKDVSALMSQVEQFSGKPKDKQYLYLDEMLTRNLIKLDNIDTQGQENIRQARKEAIKCIEKCISILEAKAAANAQQEQQQQTEQKEESQPKEEVQEQQQQMEVEQEKQPEVKPEIEVAEENKNDPQVATITNEECSKSEEKMEAVPVVGNVEKELMEMAPISPPQIETMETEQTPQSQNPEIEIKPEIAEDKKEEEIKEPEEKITETEQEEEVETKQEEKKEKKKGKKKEATKKQTS